MRLIPAEFRVAEFVERPIDEWFGPVIFLFAVRRSALFLRIGWGTPLFLANILFLPEFRRLTGNEFFIALRIQPDYFPHQYVGDALLLLGTHGCAFGGQLISLFGAGELGNRFTGDDLLGVFRVARGELEAIEQEARALGVNLLVGEGHEHLGDGVLNGAAVFEVR